MSKILCIETTDKICSVAVFRSEVCLGYREGSEAFQHASALTVFIQELLSELKISLNQLDAVALSSGPGSYTGLRIGASVAKGICFGANVNLISINTLQSIAVGYHNSEHRVESDLIEVMVDARRMEVYRQSFDDNLQPIDTPSALVLDENSYTNQLGEKSVTFVGTGADKYKEICRHKNARFVSKESFLSARNMGDLASSKLINEEFENIAYFEPFYLKPFFTTAKKVSTS